MAFDAYHQWLGISPLRRPPTYYDLLGIEPGEGNMQVMRSALSQRRAFVQSKRGEGHDDDVQTILEDLDEAASTLLVTEFKHGYDRQLGLHSRRNAVRRRRSHILPSWMESRVVRHYGEGSGIVGDFFGIMAVMVGSFALMAWWSFALQRTPNDPSDQAVATAQLPSTQLNEVVATEPETQVPAVLDTSIVSELTNPRVNAPHARDSEGSVAVQQQDALPSTAPTPVGLVTILRGPKEYVFDVAFSPDGQRLVSISNDGFINLWSTFNWTKIWSLEIRRALRTVRFSTDSRHVFVHYPLGMQTIDVSDASIENEFRFEKTTRGGFSPDGKYLFTRLAEKGNTGAVFSVEDGRLLLSTRHPASESCGFSSNSRYLYYGAHQVFRLDLATMVSKPLGIKKNLSDFSAYAASPDGKYLAVGSGVYWNGKSNLPGDQDVRVFDLDTNRHVARLVGHRGTIFSACFLPDSLRLLTGGAGQPPDDYNGHRSGSDNSLRLWRVASETELQKFDGHGAAILSIACSPDGKYAATGSADSTVRIWRLPE